MDLWCNQLIYYMVRKSCVSYNLEDMVVMFYFFLVFLFFFLYCVFFYFRVKIIITLLFISLVRRLY